MKLAARSKDGIACDGRGMTVALMKALASFHGGVGNGRRCRLVERRGEVQPPPTIAREERVGRSASKEIRLTPMTDRVVDEGSQTNPSADTWFL